MDVDCHFVRYLVTRKQLELRYICMKDQLADIFTKWPSSTHFKTLVQTFRGEYTLASWRGLMIKWQVNIQLIFVTNSIIGIAVFWQLCSIYKCNNQLYISLSCNKIKQEKPFSESSIFYNLSHMSSIYLGSCKGIGKHVKSGNVELDFTLPINKDGREILEKHMYGKWAVGFISKIKCIIMIHQIFVGLIDSK